MVRLQTARRMTIPAPAGVLGVFVLAQWLLTAGQPIEFSSSSKKLEAPRRNPLERYLEQPADLPRPENSMGPLLAPVYPMPLEPPPMLTRQQREKLDARRNWVFQTPDSIKPPTTPEEAFGLGPMLYEENKSRPSVLEQYLQQQRKRNLDGSPDDNDWTRRSQKLEFSKSRGNEYGQDNNSMDPWSGNREISGSEQQSSSLMTRLNALGLSTGQNHAETGLRDIFSEYTSRIKADREKAEREAQFRQLLDRNNGIATTSEGNSRNWLNQFEDTTRRELNPVAPHGREPLSLPLRRNPLDPFANAQVNDLKNRSTALDFNKKAMESINPLPQDRPMFELPKPKPPPAPVNLPVPTRSF